MPLSNATIWNTLLVFMTQLSCRSEMYLHADPNCILQVNSWYERVLRLKRMTFTQILQGKITISNPSYKDYISIGYSFHYIYRQLEPQEASFELYLAMYKYLINLNLKATSNSGIYCKMKYLSAIRVCCRLNIFCSFIQKKIDQNIFAWQCRCVLCEFRYAISLSPRPSVFPLW